MQTELSQKTPRDIRLSALRTTYNLSDFPIKVRRILRPFGIENILYRYRLRQFSQETEKYRRAGTTDAQFAAIQAKTLVFAITAGRTGTLFLQTLFSILPETTSLHEPEPAFHRYMRDFWKDTASARAFLLQYKLPAIAATPTKRYVELNHIFCKGFLEPLLGLGIIPGLIFLRRDPRSVALSYLERYTIPERTYYGLEYLLSPRQPDVTPLPNWCRMTDYQLVFWYALEIERRQRAYFELIRSHGGAACDITAEELNDFDNFIAMVDTFGMLDETLSHAVLRQDHAGLAKRNHNLNVNSLRISGDLVAEEEEVWTIVERSEPDLRDRVEQRYSGAPRPSFYPAQAQANIGGDQIQLSQS